MKGNFMRARPWLVGVLAISVAAVITAAVIIGFSNKNSSDNRYSAEEPIQEDTAPESLSYTRVDPKVVKSSWAVVGVSKADGSGFKEVKDEHIVFDDKDMRYYKKDKLVMNYAYRFADEFTIELVNHDDVKDQRSWLLQELKKDGDSEITITDSTADLKYYIELAPDFEDPELAKQVTMEYLNGWWKMTETGRKGNREALPDSWMYFADGRMYYYANGIQVTDNAVSLDKQTLVMTNELLGVTLYWEVAKEENGDVLYTDSSGIEYYCTKGDGYSSTNPDGFWEMYAVSVVDGSNYSPLSSCYLVFSGNSCKYYVGGKLTTDNTFYWLDDWTINITTQDGTTDEWVIIDRGNGSAIITGKNRMLAYYVRRTSPIDFDPELVGEAISDADLQGAWNVLSWQLLDGTQYTEPEGWQFVFEDGLIKYYINGVLINTNSYSFTDPTHMTLKTISSYDGEGVGNTTEWELKINNGIVTIKDRNLGLIYRMTKDTTDLGESVDITTDMLQGTWKVVSSDADGFNTDKYWTFTFDGSNVTFKGDNTYRYTYTLKDNVITADLTGYDFQQTWKLALTKDGQLTIAIGGNYTYICEKDSGENKPEEKTSSISNTELEGIWVGSIGETYTFDGNGACTVDFTTSEYPTLGVVEYTYTLDEDTGKAVATYAGGDQHWSFTKADDGTITLAIEETGYSTTLTKLDMPPEKPEPQPEPEPTAITNAELKGIWSGSIGETYTFDGEGGCTVDFTTSEYPALGIVEYTYELDEDTGKAVATYADGTQNWTFTKAENGAITMSIKETAYSTPLTRLDTPPEKPEPQPEPEPTAITNAELKGIWSGSIGETYTFDGEGGCT
ncbi:MAG: hypothetical protein J5928_05935, partial [Firmicutes bacterium]|nr:hypothetical protein [Bacillota bacterium]